MICGDQTAENFNILGETPNKILKNYGKTLTPDWKKYEFFVAKVAKLGFPNPLTPPPHTPHSQ